MAVEGTYVVCARAESDEGGTEQGGDSPGLLHVDNISAKGKKPNT